MKIKTNKYTVRLRYITGTCRALLKLKKKKKTEHDRTQNRHGHY